MAEVLVDVGLGAGEDEIEAVACVLEGVLHPYPPALHDLEALRRSGHERHAGGAFQARHHRHQGQVAGVLHVRLEPAPDLFDPAQVLLVRVQQEAI